MHGLTETQPALLNNSSCEDPQASMQGAQAGWCQSRRLGAGCFESRKGALEIDNLLSHDGNARWEHDLRGKMLVGCAAA